MNLEYLGLPGSGKSYLCKQLDTYLVEHDSQEFAVFPLIESQNALVFNGSKIIRALGFVLTSFPTSLRVLSLVYRMKPESRRHQITKTIYLFSELFRVKQSHNDRVVVIEQGVLQAIWSLEMLGKQQSTAASLIKLLVPWLPHGVILIDSPDRQFYLNQLTSRQKGQSYFDQLSQEALLSECAAGEAAILSILSELELHKPGVRVNRLVNDHTINPEDTAEWIRQTISETTINAT